MEEEEEKEELNQNKTSQIEQNFEARLRESFINKLNELNFKKSSNPCNKYSHQEKYYWKSWQDYQNEDNKILIENNVCHISKRVDFDQMKSIHYKASDYNPLKGLISWNNVKWVKKYGQPQYQYKLNNFLIKIACLSCYQSEKIVVQYMAKMKQLILLYRVLRKKYRYEKCNEIMFMLTGKYN